MTLWLVLSIVALVLSPLAWLKPSRRQHGQIAARLQARREGLAMQLVPQQWPHWLQAAPPERCPRYAVARATGLPVWAYWQASPGRWVNQWREPCEDEIVLQVLSTLPADAWKVEAQKGFVAVFWGERGDIAAVAAALRALAPQ